MLKFESEAMASDPVLELPADVVIRTRSCRVAKAFTVIDCLTSAELVLELTRSFGTMSLERLQYSVVTDIDNSLMWSRISAVEQLGTLWEPGLRLPLFATLLKQRRADAMQASVANRLRTGDPLAAGAIPRRRMHGKRPRQRSGAAARSVQARPPADGQGARPDANAANDDDIFGAPALAIEDGADIAVNPALPDEDLIGMASAQDLVSPYGLFQTIYKFLKRGPQIRGKPTAGTTANALVW